MEDLKSLYKDGVNISRYLREKYSLEYNDDRIIELTYDLQSGSYVEAQNDDEKRVLKKSYTNEMASIIERYCPNPYSILKGGTGECITLLGLLQGLKDAVQYVHGFDMCWSRIAYGRRYLAKNSVDNVKLCTGKLTSPPYAEDAFQVVVTSHSMEPNGGREKEILEALHRVTGDWLILFEPSFEHADDEGKDRMRKLGYVKDIPKHAMDLGYEVVDHFPLKNVLNSKNPTSVTVIKKGAGFSRQPDYACPITHKPVVHTNDGLFSESGMCIYPIISGVPCLKSENGIIASKYAELMPDSLK